MVSCVGPGCLSQLSGSVLTDLRRDRGTWSVETRWRLSGLLSVAKLRAVGTSVTWPAQGVNQMERVVQLDKLLKRHVSATDSDHKLVAFLLDIHFLSVIIVVAFFLSSKEHLGFGERVDAPFVVVLATVVEDFSEVAVDVV